MNAPLLDLAVMQFRISYHEIYAIKLTLSLLMSVIGSEKFIFEAELSLFAMAILICYLFKIITWILLCHPVSPVFLLPTNF